MKAEQEAFNSMFKTDKLYTDTYNYLVKLYGPKAVFYDDEFCVINITLTNVYYNISLSGNEQKMYFGNIESEIVSNLKYNDIARLKSFRVFEFENAKKYIDFKNEEDKLITLIQE